MMSRSNGDSYRPRQSAEFDSYRPHYGADQSPPPPPSDAHAAMYHFKGTRDNNRRSETSSRGGRRGGFTYRNPPKAHERPLLTSRRESPDHVTFPSDNAQDKFRDLEELTESDETDMDVSDSEDADDRPSKRLRVSADDTVQSAVPKWSNPDPYTALPPSEDSSRKKTDVVKLIRKARNNPTLSQTAPATHDDDYISFDFEDDQWDDESLAPSNAPTGPRLDRRINPDTSINEMQPDNHTLTNGDGLLGKRKRVEYEKPSEPVIFRGRQWYSDGMILPEWQTTQVNSSPWLKQSLDHADHPGIALHKEIIDFYDWVRPKDFEANIRADLVTRLQDAFNRLEPGELRAFGSYAAGLYLPIGDMDLVYLQQSRSARMINGYPPKLSMAHFRKYQSFLATQEIAKPGTIQIIGHAKVQIIKFVDRITGLKVDLCFNNQSGLAANDTFQTWKASYPAMPIICSIIKQFLMIRGLNDVAVGGLGGFSTICLVTSLIQHMPFNGQSPNLGKYLLEFFNLYGNLFNRHDVAIRLNPPGYIDKSSYAPHLFNNDKPGRLTIIDPNKPENNISGGTNKIDLICKCFSQAHESLDRQLSEYIENPKSIQSFLASIVGGGFASYEAQRDILRGLHPADIPPPPPATSTRTKAPPPPPPVPASSIDTGSSYPSHPAEKDIQKSSANEKRAQRLKTYRPDLAGRIPKKLSVTQAVSLGGYTDGAYMSADLRKREKLAAVTKKMRKRNEA